MGMVLFSELNLNAFFGMKQPPKIEGDVPEDSVDHACGIHHGFIDAPNVLKQKVIKRILLLSKRRIESRFPGSTYRGSHPCGSWMRSILMILYVGFELILLLCFLFKVCSVQQVM
jgi:hypothetical protein